ncbi:MAG TPA: VCBS repeat-containing protein, partial [Planctomycetes bacterium]|nr:VCBS repeat-containing protein [Planctomycetota bacterium]
MTNRRHLHVLCLLLSPLFMSLLFTAQAAHVSAEEICFNGIDDDADALIDCDDPECQPGYFTKSIEELGASDSHNVALGDLDADGDIDAFIANKNGQGNTVWINDGYGNFTDSGQALGSSKSRGV